MRAVVIAAAASLAAAGAFTLSAAPAAAQGGGWAQADPVPRHGDPGPGPVDPRPDWRDHRDWLGYWPLRETVVIHGPSVVWDSNRSFDPDRWNDWWHERPWRAYPRWVTNNQNCAPDRMWWSGGAWRC